MAHVGRHRMGAWCVRIASDYQVAAGRANVAFLSNPRKSHDRILMPDQTLFE